MTQISNCDNILQEPDPQKTAASEDDITASQEQQNLPDRLPKSLIEWLARPHAPAANVGVNRRYLALNQEKTNDTG